MTLRKIAGLGALLSLALPGVALAAEEPVLNSGDTAWMLISTALVLLMTIPGLALFYGGMVRAKNVLSIMMQCFAITGLITILWVVYGYSLAFDTAGMEKGVLNFNSFVGGLDKAFLSGLTADGLSGARHILEGEQGMAAGMSSDADPERLVDRLGSRWALLETSFKFHASCRHTHPAADALLALMQREGLDHSQIAAVTARVHQGAIDVLGRVVEPQTVHQAKFSMGTVLGLIAVYGKAGLGEFHRHVLSDPRVAAFRERVEMRLDPDVDAAYPQRWLGRVEVLDRQGRRHTAAIDEPKGDPGNTLSRDELADKFRRLLAFSGAATDAEAEILIQRAWGLRQAPSVTPLI